MPVNMKHELSPDAARFLAYMLGLIQAGRVVPSTQALLAAFDPPMTMLQLGMVFVELRRAGFEF